MAKCPVCNTRKGKRKCGVVNNQFVCSLCCANTRKGEICATCVFYLPPQHDYDKAPAFSSSAIANNHALEGYSQLIQNAFKTVGLLEAQDEVAILELLINKYHFQEQEVYSFDDTHKAGFSAADNAIVNNLAEVDTDILANVLGAMRRVAKSRLES